MTLGCPVMEVDLVMSLHLIRQSVILVIQVIRLQEAGAEHVWPRVHGQGIALRVQVSSIVLSIISLRKIILSRGTTGYQKE